MRRKKIDFEEKGRWHEQLADSEKKRLESMWRQYIKWRGSDKTIFDKDERSRIKAAFIDGLLVGMLDLQ